MEITRKEREMILKSTAFDLISLIKSNDSFDEETKRKVTELIKDYVRKSTGLRG